MSRINLLPHYHVCAIRCRRRLRLWAGVLAGYILLLAAACVAANMHWMPGVSNVRELQAARQQVRQTDTALAVARKELASLETKKLMIKALVDQPDWAVFLRLVAQRLGPNLVVRDLKLHKLVVAPSGPAAPSPKVASRKRTYQIELRGLARSQSDLSQWIASLEETKLFDEVRLLRTAREPFLNGAATSFDLECRITDEGSD